MEKRKLRCEGIFSHLRYYFTNDNGENIPKWVANLMLKFHNDPTVKRSEIIIFLRQVWVYAGKKGVLGEEEGKMKLRGRWRVETYHHSEWPNMSLFLTRVLPAYYLLYFSLFLLFYKHELYFILYQMNK